MGVSSLEDTVDRICTPDVLVHTWDLARATGLDESLDPDEVHRFVESMEPARRCARAGTTDPGSTCPPTPTSRRD
jgi:hypothetical protein